MAKDNRQKQSKPALIQENQVVKWCDNIIFLLVLFTLASIPLYFNIMAYDQFEMPKLTLLRVLTSAMLGLWLIKIFETGKFEYIPTPLDFPLLAWVALNIITTFTSFAPHLSFRGEYENFAGSLSNINYVALYYIAAQNLRSKKQVEFINYTALLTGGLLTIYALMQFFGYDFIKWNEGSMIKGRYFASMGNPNFLGAVLIMIIPVNISFFILALKARKNLLAGSLFVVFVALYLSLFGTQSRGPFLGFAASLLVFGGYGIYRFNKDKSGLPEYKGKNFFAILLAETKTNYKSVLIALAVAVMAVVFSATLGKDATGRLLHSVTHFQESMAVSRLHIWVPSLRMIKDNPLLGTGVDTFKSVFPKYEGTEFAVIDGANVSSRTAHNELLNVAATMGLVSLGVYLLLIWSYITMWYRSFGRIKEANIKLLSLAMFAGFTAYFVQNLFSFGVSAINTYLYVFFAAQAYLYNDAFGVKRRALVIFNGEKRPMLFLKIILQFTAVFLACFFAYKASMLYSADVHYNKGKIWGNVQNRWDLAVQEHLKSVEEAPDEVKYYVYLALAYERLAMETQDKEAAKELVHKAAAAYKKGVEINPGNSYYWGNLGRIYSMMARSEDPKYFDEAEKYYLTAISKAPVTGLFYSNLIDLYLGYGMVDKAMPLLEKLCIYDKKMAAQGYFVVGNMAFGKKAYAQSEDYYRKSVVLDPNMAQSYYNLGVLCAGRKDKGCVKENMEKFIELSPASDMVPNAKKIMREAGIK